MVKKQFDAYIKFGEIAGKYGRQYEKSDFTEFYPEHRYRLRIFMELLDNVRPRKILDIGCGSGEPLITMLERGFDAHGFDYSMEMVNQAKLNLSEKGLDAERVSHNNMENPQNIVKGEYDCIVALGSLYYSRDFDTTLKRLSEIIQPGGHIIFSLRNDLFSLFTLNQYSIEYYLQNLIPESSLSDDLRNRLHHYLVKRFGELNIQKKTKTIDDIGIHSTSHNPLTVENDVLKPSGLVMQGIYYYHYHALPPVFEHTDTAEFRKLSARMENPTDWRGMFMCSTFIVHARKELSNPINQP